MHLQSDHGYSANASGCIACGSHRIDCCDGKGNELSLVDRAKWALAKAMLNQVGVEWDEACDSVEFLVSQQGDDVSDDELIQVLREEAYRYEDM